MSKNCNHKTDTDRWIWEPRGFKKPLVPAYTVYCENCDELLFTVIFDGEKSVVNVSDNQTVAFEKYVKAMDWDKRKNPTKGKLWM